MEKRYLTYLKDLGIDIENDSHPLSKEYNFILKSGDPDLIKSIEHLLLILILDLEKVKNHNKSDYEKYLKRIAKKDISFWGERFELHWYSSLIHGVNEPILNLRRGLDGEEPDFLFEYEGITLGIETTSLTYEESSLKKNPISKIKSLIKKKNETPYQGNTCALFIDISNLSFHRRLEDKFSITIFELFKNIQTGFGALYLFEGKHIRNGNNPRYVLQAYDWMSPDINPELERLLSLNMRGRPNKGDEEFYFKIG